MPGLHAVMNLVTDNLHEASDLHRPQVVFQAPLPVTYLLATST